MKKLLTAILCCILSFNIVGCNQQEKVEDNQKSEKSDLKTNSDIQLQSVNGTVDEVNVIDTILTVKVHMNNSMNDGDLITKSAFSNVYYFTQQLDLDKYSKLQYWQVVENEDGTINKEISFTIDKPGLQQISDSIILWNDLDQMKSIVKDFYIQPQYKNDLPLTYRDNQKYNTQKTAKNKNSTNSNKKTNSINSNKNNSNKENIYNSYRYTCCMCGIQSNSVELHYGTPFCKKCWNDYEKSFPQSDNTDNNSQDNNNNNEDNIIDDENNNINNDLDTQFQTNE